MPIWEREPGAQLLEPTALPDPVRDSPMARDEFDALVNATRWTLFGETMEDLPRPRKRR